MTRIGEPAVTRKVAAGAALLTAVVLAGCGEVADQKSSSPDTAGQSSASTTPSARSSSPQSADAQSMALKPNVSDDATGVHVDKHLAVSADNDGKLASVSVSGTAVDHGKTHKVSVDGKLTKDQTKWSASERLEPSAEYKIHMVGKKKNGDTTKRTVSFDTKKLSLNDQIYPNLKSTPSGKVGVGTPVILKFDTPVHNKARFERHLHVTSSPKQKGTWSWINNKEVHFRPKTWWKPGTKVKATADLNSVPAGNGKYGQKSASTSFTVGKKVHTKVNLKTNVARVFVNGKRKKKIQISAGKPGDDTRSGTTLIMAKHTDYRMTSEMIGLPSTGPKSYDLKAAYAMRTTTSGEFLHSAPWNAGYFGKANKSHGCTGMSIPDSKWLYHHVTVGSPVTTTGSKHKLGKGNGWTDWNQSYAKYKKGSAL